MRNFGYKKLDIYTLSRELAIQIYNVTRKLPENEHQLKGIGSQLRRAVVSVSSNISEGSSRKNKQFLHFLSVSYGSLREVETQVEIAYDIGYINVEKRDEILKIIDECSAKMTKFMRRIDREILEEDQMIRPRQR